MVGIYADESETAETPRVFSLVCCVGSPSGWARLEPEWRRMLLEGGPDPVSAFHAKDVAQGKNEFSAWSGEAREAFYARAIDLLFDDTLLANMYVAGCAMVVDDFAEAIPGGWKPLVADLYLKCFDTLLRNAFSMSPVMGAAFVLDHKEKVKGRVNDMFEAAKKRLPAELEGRLESLTFADDRDVFPLQIADLIAYEWRRRLWEKRARPDAEPRVQYLRLRNGFKTVSDPGAVPPYRLWNMRCYDRAWIHGFAAVPLPNVDLTELWFSLPVPPE